MQSPWLKCELSMNVEENDEVENMAVSPSIIASVVNLEVIGLVRRGILIIF